jgi:hypothetical protein
LIYVVFFCSIHDLDNLAQFGPFAEFHRDLTPICTGGHGGDTGADAAKLMEKRNIGWLRKECFGMMWFRSLVLVVFECSEPISHAIAAVLNRRWRSSLSRQFN